MRAMFSTFCCGQLGFVSYRHTLFYFSFFLVYDLSTVHEPQHDSPFVMRQYCIVDRF